MKKTIDLQTIAQKLIAYGITPEELRKKVETMGESVPDGWSDTIMDSLEELYDLESDLVRMMLTKTLEPNQTMTKERMTPCCHSCKSTNLDYDVYAQWNNKKQELEFEVTSVYCNDCYEIGNYELIPTYQKYESKIQIL